MRVPLCAAPSHACAEAAVWPMSTLESSSSEAKAGSSIVGRPRKHSWLNATQTLSLCDMSTLYLRNVPDEVSDKLSQLAAREGMSVSAFVIRELASVARRADNPELLGDLPDLEVTPEVIVGHLEAGRAAR